MLAFLMSVLISFVQRSASLDIDTVGLGICRWTFKDSFYDLSALSTQTFMTSLTFVDGSVRYYKFRICSPNAVVDDGLCPGSICSYDTNPYSAKGMRVLGAAWFTSPDPDPLFEDFPASGIVSERITFNAVRPVGCSQVRACLVLRGVTVLGPSVTFFSIPVPDVPNGCLLTVINFYCTSSLQLYQESAQNNAVIDAISVRSDASDGCRVGFTIWTRAACPVNATAETATDWLAGFPSPIPPIAAPPVVWNGCRHNPCNAVQGASKRCIGAVTWIAAASGSVAYGESISASGNDSFICECGFGWTGERCTQRQTICGDVRTQSNGLTSVELCSNNGDCDENGQFCWCDSGFENWNCSDRSPALLQTAFEVTIRDSSSVVPTPTDSVMNPLNETVVELKELLCGVPELTIADCETQLSIESDPPIRRARDSSVIAVLRFQPPTDVSSGLRLLWLRTGLLSSNTPAASLRPVIAAVGLRAIRIAGDRAEAIDGCDDGRCDPPPFEGWSTLSIVTFVMICVFVLTVVYQTFLTLRRMEPFWRVRYAPLPLVAVSVVSRPQSS